MLVRRSGLCLLVHAAASATLLVLGSLEPAAAATITAASCSQSAVAAAITSAAAGDTVQVPTGTCSWSGLSISKAIHLKGAGTSSTLITVSANRVSKQSNGVTKITDIGFSKSGGGGEGYGWEISGAWPTGYPVIFSGNTFTISGSNLFLVSTPGGFIFANNTVTAEWDDSILKLKMPSDTASWAAADTIGAADTTGFANIYIETNTFTGGTNQGIDADDSSRVVVRYNRFVTSSVNSHGWDTSPVGVRHWEIYNNVFQHPGGGCTTQLCNQNWLILMRGGTGVITDNQFVDIAGSWWGNKDELSFWVRGAEDARPQGSCGNVSYPVPRQVGQNHNGTSYFTDPIRIWNNTGPQGITAEWRFGNPCALNFSDFWQLNRDYALSARPSYSKYAYPHPLLSGSTPPTNPQPPSPPTNLRVIP